MKSELCLLFYKAPIIEEYIIIMIINIVNFSCGQMISSDDLINRKIKMNLSHNLTAGWTIATKQMVDNKWLYITCKIKPFLMESLFKIHTSQLN